MGRGESSQGAFGHADGLADVQVKRLREKKRTGKLFVDADSPSRTTA